MPDRDDVGRLVAELQHAVAVADHSRGRDARGGLLATGRRTARALVTAGLCVTIVVLVAAVGAEIAGFRLMVVRSGSMQPTIAVGAIVVSEAVRPADIRPRDIVTFRDPALHDATVTHRVVSAHDVDGTYQFVTKGDANTTTEHWSIASTGTLGREVLIVPGLGRVLMLLKTRLLLMSALFAFAAWLTTIALRRVWSSSRRRTPIAAGSASITWIARVCVALLMIAAAAAVTRPASAAAWAITGTNTGNAFTTAASFPTITSVVLANGSGTAGRIDKGDTITVTFSETMKVSSFCSAWSGDSTNQSINGNNAVTVTVTDGTGATNDSLTVTSTTCTFNFGSINLGSNNYVSGGNGSFSGTGANKSSIAWTAATHVLTVTLGGATGTFNTVASSTPVYTVATAVTNPAGARPYNSPYTLAAGQQF